MVHLNQICHSGIVWFLEIEKMFLSLDGLGIVLVQSSNVHCFVISLHCPCNVVVVVVVN